MRHSCSIHYSVLFLLTFITVNTLASTSVTAKLHQSATLSCNNKCSGVVTWSMFHNPGNILAQCNKTKCWSEKGYEVSHDQYLKGKFLLTITAVDYSNRALYTCVCDGVDACDVRLIIQTVTSLVHLNSGEALVMDLPILEPVEVMYKTRDSADLYGSQICTVNQRSLQCQPEYTHRASLSYPNITLRDVNMTDSGTYSIWDRKNEDIIHIYTLIVNVVQHESERKFETWIGVSVGLFMLVSIVIVVVLVMKNRHKKFRNLEKSNPEETIKLNGCTSEVKSRPRSDSDAKADQLARQMVELDKLIQRYNSESMRKSQSWTNQNDIPVVEMLTIKKTEMEAVVQRRQDSEQDTICQWWRLKRPELDTIIEHWTKYNTELDQFKQNLCNKVSHQSNPQTRCPKERRRIHSCPPDCISQNTQSMI
ncbi:uncharacterized protein LOC113640025 [Tachysurus fulvidraco]|uniref:uncharacterized protein LOC113640025 n=1 Tax=Tachysurus fulvidraco TaxID=1234273 RepID=UPI001FEFA3EA|nr:uncharacterized protein LOC113640025 [Tachysurus fulvidraco]XP_026998151.2 uncharacterized protein LOC113640025 [Tachysurus fulvidraco]XP_047674486.1 uncharacterized protein LOC113640025 [Tachysurus fulvidraco]